MWAVSTQRWVRYNSATHPVFHVFALCGLVDFSWGMPWDDRSGWDAGPAEFNLGLFLPIVSIRDIGPYDGVVNVNVPCWLMLTLAAIPTAILWRRDRRSAKPGHCLTCGYDLQASKKTCPECGAAMAAEARD